MQGYGGEVTRSSHPPKSWKKRDWEDNMVEVGPVALSSEPYMTVTKWYRGRGTEDG